MIPILIPNRTKRMMIDQYFNERLKQKDRES